MSDDLEKFLGPRQGFEKRQAEATEKIDQHPELREGEVFLGNVTKQEGISGSIYRSTRLGDVAYDSKGQPIEGMFPTFANKEEMDEV